MKRENYNTAKKVTPKTVLTTHQCLLLINVAVQVLYIYLRFFAKPITFHGRAYYDV